jgi:2-phospho-L-lactate guanylyltransferase
VSVTAIVPLKALEHSKQRLSGRLSAIERHALMRGLFLHVLDVCMAAECIDETLAIVGGDAGVALARQRSVTVVRDPGGDLNSALRHAAARLPRGSTSLVIVADLPEVTVDDLEAIVSAGRQAPTVLVAPTHDGGTGALLRRPARIIAPAFGPGSAAAHLLAAQAAGVRTGVIMRPGLAHDVDRPEDLDRLGNQGLRGSWFRETHDGPTAMKL